MYLLAFVAFQNKVWRLCRVVCLSLSSLMRDRLLLCLEMKVLKIFHLPSFHLPPFILHLSSLVFSSFIFLSFHLLSTSWFLTSHLSQSQKQEADYQKHKEICAIRSSLCLSILTMRMQRAVWPLSMLHAVGEESPHNF